MSENVHYSGAVNSLPASERRSLLTISLNMAGGPICVAALFLGAAIAQHLNFTDCAIAVTSAGAILAIYGGALGLIGFRTGYPSAMLIGETFGHGGKLLLGATITVSLVGWYAVQAALFGDMVHTMFPNGGFLTDARVATTWGGILMLSTAVFGFHGLSILSLIAVPLLILMSAWGVYQAASGHSVLSYTPPEPGSMGTAITMVVGALAVGATITADVTRYCRSAISTWVACAASYLFTNAFMLICGAITLMATGSGNLIGAMVALGMGIPAFFVLVAGQWTTQDDNLYSSSLAVNAVFPRIPEWVVVIVLGLFATALGTIGVHNLFIPFLTLLGVLIPPIGGVLIADHLFFKRTPKDPPTPAAAFAAWIGGAAVGYSVSAGLPALNAIGTSLVIFSLFKFMRRS